MHRAAGIADLWPDDGVSALLVLGLLVATWAVVNGWREYARYRRDKRVFGKRDDG